MSKKQVGMQVSKSLFFSFGAMAINYAISLLLTPYITETMGADAYGFVSLAKTISNYGIIITTCLNAYASRYIAIAYHQENIGLANKYFSSVVIANYGLLVLTMFFTGFLVWKIETFFVIPSELLLDARLLFGLDILNFMLLAIFNTYSVYGNIKGCLHKVHIIRACSYVVEICVLFILFLVFDPKIYYVGIALVVSSITLGILNKIVISKELPDLKVRMNSFSFSAVKDLVASGIWNSFNSIGNLLNSGLDLWVCNRMLTATNMGELSIVKTISTIFTTTAQMLSTPFQPYLLDYYSKNKIEKVVQLFKRQIQLSGYVVSIVCAGFISLGSVYYSLWTPNQNIDLINGISIVTTVGFFFEGIVTPLFYTYTLTLKNKVPCVLTIVSGLLNVFGMYLLLTHTGIGLYAVVGTTTVLGFFNYFIFTPLYSAHCMKQKWYAYYGSIGRSSLAFIILTIVFCLIAKCLEPSSWVGLILCALFMLVIGTSIYLLIAVPFSELKNYAKKLYSVLQTKKDRVK